MTYDTKRYFYLLEQEEIFKKYGVSFYKVKRKDSMELLNYKVRLKNRQKYLDQWI
jgi:hypothetical protein